MKLKKQLAYITYIFLGLFMAMPVWADFVFVNNSNDSFTIQSKDPDCLWTDTQQNSPFSVTIAPHASIDVHDDFHPSHNCSASITDNTAIGTPTENFNPSYNLQNSIPALNSSFSSDSNLLALNFSAETYLKSDQSAGTDTLILGSAGSTCYHVGGDLCLT